MGEGEDAIKSSLMLRVSRWRVHRVSFSCCKKLESELKIIQVHNNAIEIQANQ